MGFSKVPFCASFFVVGIGAVRRGIRVDVVSVLRFFMCLYMLTQLWLICFGKVSS